MGLNIKNREVESLAEEVARATGETKTEAIRIALLERRQRLAMPSLEERVQRQLEKLERETWSLLSPESRGHSVSKGEYDALFE